MTVALIAGMTVLVLTFMTALTLFVVEMVASRRRAQVSQVSHQHHEGTVCYQCAAQQREAA